MPRKIEGWISHRLRQILFAVTIDALSGWTVGFAGQLLLHMAAAAQFMKLGFHQISDLHIADMAVKTHAGTRIVDKIVMAYDTVLRDVIGVGKMYCEQVAGRVRDALRLRRVAAVDLRAAHHQGEQDGNQQQQAGCPQDAKPFKHTNANAASGGMVRLRHACGRGSDAIRCAAKVAATSAANSHASSVLR